MTMNDKKAKELIDKLTLISWGAIGFTKLTEDVQEEIKEQATLCCDRLIDKLKKLQSESPMLSNYFQEEINKERAVKESINKY